MPKEKIVDGKEVIDFKDALMPPVFEVMRFLDKLKDSKIKTECQIAFLEQLRNYDIKTDYYNKNADHKAQIKNRSNLLRFVADLYDIVALQGIKEENE